MTTVFYTHSACLEHDTTDRHPECVARLEAVMSRVATPEFDALERREAPRATLDQIALAHAPDYIDWVMAAIPASGHIGLDADTIVSSGSGEAALRAAGACCAAVDAIVAGEAKNAFCAVRPPGHHAEAARAMGFCIFNNIGIGALHARAAHGFERVAVIDFDVHHGNGTEALFRKDTGLFFGSTHQSPLYPGTGAREVRGVGNIFNEPLPSGAGGAEFRQAMEGHILPALDAFGPDFIMISAGFDAHRNDPLAGLRFEEEDYAWITRKLVQMADRHCRGRIVSSLEGGYDLSALTASVAVHLRELMAA